MEASTALKVEASWVSVLSSMSVGLKEPCSFVMGLLGHSHIPSKGMFFGQILQLLQEYGCPQSRNRAST